MQNYLNQLYESVSPHALFPEKINLYFNSDLQNCTCDKLLHAYKTKKRKISTFLTGSCTAHIKLHKCLSCKKIYSPRELQLIVPKKGNFCFDIIVYIGKALFIENRNDEEIQNYLISKKISISLREINYLGKKFIIYLALAHRASSYKIKREMEIKGGYILHLDGTCEGDSPHLFSFIDQLSNIVLNNIKIPSENSEKIIPALLELKKTYGKPIAIVHDMSKAIIRAAEYVFPHVKDFVCHLHFLRDIGKDLFNVEYNSIRRYLKTSKIKSQLRYIVRSLKLYIDQDSQLQNCLNASIKKDFFKNDCDTLKVLVAFYLTVTWVLESRNKSHGYGFPFDRPHVDFCDRLKEAYPTLVKLKKEMPENSLNLSLSKLKSAISDTSLENSLKLIKSKIIIFDELRDAMRIVPTDGEHGLNDNGDAEEIKTIETEVKKFRMSKKIIALSKSDIRYRKMIKQIDKYWDKLFSDPIKIKKAEGDIIIQPQRTNNTLEQFFRSIKSDGRKKSGTSSLSKKLKTMISNTPLVKNLAIPKYVDILLDGKKDLAERFADIDIESVRAEFQKENEAARKYPKGMARIFRMSGLPSQIERFALKKHNFG